MTLSRETIEGLHITGELQLGYMCLSDDTSTGTCMYQ